ncbi:MAG: hypothetical protein NC412_00415 [Roseburia sp.]|nr:hypothetical protein [Roseburia sp.]MCM1278580.1 hypothetical protein [Robinsoniella sp.]
MTDSEKLDLILEKVSSLDGKVNNLDEKVNSLETELQEIKQRVIKTELTIENEICITIQRVVEGHLDLSRKLNECIRLSSDIKDKQEMQDIYTNTYNNKLRVL